MPLLFQGLPITADEKTKLFKAGVSGGATIYCAEPDSSKAEEVPVKEPEMAVVVRIPRVRGAGWDSMHVDVPISATVRSLRERVIETDRSIASSSGFKWRGVRLDDQEGSMLRSLGIVDGATLYVECIPFSRGMYPSSLT